MDSRVKSGYTILEVMLVVAISSLMLTAAMLAVRGRQSQVEFAQAVRDFESVVSDIVNDVQTGYYPTLSTVRCDGATTSPVTFSFTSTGQKLGTNDNCLLAGKVLHFRPDINNNTLTDGQEGSTVIAYPLVGNRYYPASGRSLADTLDEIKPQVVASTITSEADISDTLSAKYGLEVEKVIQYTGMIKSEFGAIVIMSNFGGSSLSGNNLSQSLQIGGVKGTTPVMSKNSFKSAVNQLQTTNSANPGYVAVNPDSGIILCLQDDRQRKASITIGSKDSSGVVLKIGDRDVRCDA